MSIREVKDGLLTDSFPPDPIANQSTPATEAASAPAEGGNGAAPPARRRRSRRPSKSAPPTSSMTTPPPPREPATETQALEPAPQPEATTPATGPSASRRRRRSRSKAAASSIEPTPAEQPPEATEAVAADAEAEPAKAPRRRRRRSSRATEPIPEDVAPFNVAPDANEVASLTEVSAEGSTEEGATAPSRRRRRHRRGGRGKSAATEAPNTAETPTAIEAPATAEIPGTDEIPDASATTGATVFAAVVPSDRGRLPSKRERATKGPDATEDVPFMHSSEREIAKLLDFYGVKYLYEPRSFPLRWDGDRVVEMFSPDFYLPVQDQYLELTTMKQSLVTQKNRKLRHLRELYPEINILLLYRRDILRLLAKYGYGPLGEAEVQGIERTLFTAEQIQQRVQELGRQITQDYQGQEIVLIGVLRGVVCFMADLMRSVDLPLAIDFMEISHFSETPEEPVTVTKDVDISVEGKPVILVEDIVDTGMTIQFLLRHLWSKNPSSVAVCTLLDKKVRRMNEVPMTYQGFEIPDEFVVGYGLDYQGLYRNRPDIAILKPVEPKIIPQR